MTIDELRSLVQRLNSLLNDKEGEGMASWSLSVSNLMDQLVAKWDGLSPKDSKIEQLEAELAASRRSQNYWKAELNAANKIIINLEQELRYHEEKRG